MLEFAQKAYAMCIPKVTRVAHPNNTQDDANNAKDGKGYQKPHAPFQVLNLVDWITSDDREAPSGTPDEI